MPIDYSQLAFPKVKPKAAPAKPAKGPVARDRAKRNRKAAAVAGTDRERVRQRQRGRCFAEGISPVCTGLMQDPHELIPVGAGGKRESRNRVGLCRKCHDEAQGRVGGNRLVFTWRGQRDGKPPNADEPGNVGCRWQERPARNLRAGEKKGCKGTAGV